MSAPVWGKVATPVAASLGDVMSEELALQFADEEGGLKSQTGIFQPALAVGGAVCSDNVEEETDNDLLLAQMLQHEFDRENDRMLKLEEEKFNGTSNVRLSYQKYRSVHPSLQKDDEDFDEEEIDEEEFSFTASDPKSFKKGVSGKGKNMVSKHDADICGRRNTAKIDEQFPLDFGLGDCSRVDNLRISNQVYSKLKRHAMNESKRSHKVNEKKDHATADMVVDPRTRLLLYKMVNLGLLSKVDGVISSGKESVVYHGTGGEAQEVLMPPEVAIKVFKTTLAEFKNRCQYVKGDVRFFKDHFKKQNPRKIMRVWAEKENVNLKRLSNFGIPVPRPLLLKKHVLLLEFIGKDQRAAPKLKDAKLSDAEYQLAYEQVTEDMIRMYRDARLVHGDLSEYNLLWHEDHVVFIDVAQTVDIMHPYAMEFLLRDCHNICQFFSKHGVPTMSHYELFNKITGKEFTGEGGEFLSQVEEYEKSQDFLEQATSKKDYPFDFFFDLAQKQAEDAKEEKDDEEEEDDDDSDIESWELVPSVSPTEDFVKIDKPLSPTE